jgi:hypothetical protein
MPRSLAARLAGVAGAVVLSLVLAPAVLAKEGVEVTLAAPIPADAGPGDTVTVFFTLARISDAGTSPLRGSPVYLRLSGPTGATTQAEGVETRTPGTYAASIVIPAGGATRAEFGIHGAAVDAGGGATTSDLVWPYDGILVAAAPPAAVDPGDFQVDPAKPAPAAQAGTGAAGSASQAAVADPTAPGIDARVVAGGLLAVLALVASVAVGRRRPRPTTA